MGTALLLAAIVGSGIMAERLAGGNTALALLANSLATGAALVCLIGAFQSISGAHLNPVVTLSDALLGRFRWQDVPAYIASQLAGALAGVAAANVMFGLPPFEASHHARDGAPVLLGEFVATFGLLAVVIACARRRRSIVPLAVAGYIVAAYWFTSSTSFANPAVTLARAFSDTFTGIRPVDVPGFVAAQLAGGAAATSLFAWLLPALSTTAQKTGDRR